MALSLYLRGMLAIMVCSLAVLALEQQLYTIYIKLTPDTPCDKDPCFTLMEYVDNSSQYFTRDTGAEFLSGQHLLDRNIEVIGTGFFSMRKKWNASGAVPEIVCTAAVGLFFRNVAFVSIIDLSFISCGDVTTSAPASWVLYIESVQFFGLANATVKMAHASAAVVSNSGFFSNNNHFLDNANSGSNGGCIVATASDVWIENNQFFNNSASVFSVGGAVMVLNGKTTVFRGANVFANNKAGTGGGIALLSSNVSFEGSNTFINNSGVMAGGAISCLWSVVSFNGNTTFISSTVSPYVETTAAASNMLYSTVSFTGNTTFMNNGPSTSILAFYGSTAVIEGIFTFDSNQGTISMVFSNVTVHGIATFKNNSGFGEGNALNVVNGSRLIFTGTTHFVGNSPMAEHGAGALTVASSVIHFMGNTTFTANTGSAGAVMNALHSSIVFNGTQSFKDNVASIGGAIFMLDSAVIITGCSSFINNSADRQGGAISLTNGQLNITGIITFIGNQARFGGGMYFSYTSQMFLISPLELSFWHNSAEQGGAIYVSDATDNILCFNSALIDLSTDIGSCFIRTEYEPGDIQLIFDSNTASYGGDNVFGGMLGRCNLNDNYISPINGLSLLVSMTGISTISSEPINLCFCVNGKENCTYEPPPFSIVRGGTISLSAVALDQTNRTVAATVRSYFPYNNGTVSDFSLGQGVQQIGATCTPLNYTIQTTASNVTFVLYAEGPCRDIDNSQRQISVRLGPCPIAFELSDTECICEVRLQSFTNSCRTESQTFSRNANFWVGTEYRDDNYTGLILHSHCPLDYCISNYPADISINDLDSQCSFNRSGILCGSCQQSLSLALGSSQCLQCSNSYLALLFPFAIAGFVLVFILFLLRLTLSIGTLSGLIFYANIMSVNKEIFFPTRKTNLLTVFIAWLNLDLGIETCFFNGMDTYTRTWLQYLFPFYIWLMVSIIIVTSHYSVRVPKLLGRNPVAVLATLFLLSYAKLLRTIIATFSATVLDYPGNSTDTVWLYDGNIRYLRGKHIPLFLFSLVILLFLFLPYTVLLFISQWLQAISNNKYLFWMNSLRMKTFLDAYRAPYNIKHRYWTGLLLLLRCVLFLVFASNASGDPSINLLAISSVALGLAMSTRVIGQVYSKWWLDILEGSFILNLGITAAATFYVMQSGGDQSAVAYISVSVALMEFTGILTYHTHLQLKDTNVWKSARETYQKLYTSIRRRKSEEHEKPPASPDEIIRIPKPPTVSYIDLREPLLDFPD